MPKSLSGHRNTCRDQSPCELMSSSVSIGPERPSDSASTASTDTVTEEKRWSPFLPLMAEEGKKRGYQLPLPFGVSTVVTGLLDRQIKITDVRVGVNGTAPT